MLHRGMYMSMLLTVVCCLLALGNAGAQSGPTVTIDLGKSPWELTDISPVHSDGKTLTFQAVLTLNILSFPQSGYQEVLPDPYVSYDPISGKDAFAGVAPKTQLEYDEKDNISNWDGVSCSNNIMMYNKLRDAIDLNYEMDVLYNSSVPNTIDTTDQGSCIYGNILPSINTKQLELIRSWAELFGDTLYNARAARKLALNGTSYLNEDMYKKFAKNSGGITWQFYETPDAISSDATPHALTKLDDLKQSSEWHFAKHMLRKTDMSDREIDALAGAANDREARAPRMFSVQVEWGVQVTIQLNKMKNHKVSCPLGTISVDSNADDAGAKSQASPDMQNVGASPTNSNWMNIAPLIGSASLEANLTSIFAGTNGQVDGVFGPVVQNTGITSMYGLCFKLCDTHPHLWVRR